MSEFGKKIYTNVYGNFIEFLKKKKIMTLATSIIISVNISIIIRSFIQTFISPLINKITGGNNIRLQDRAWTISNITFPIGDFTNKLIQFSFIIYISIFRFQFIWVIINRRNLSFDRISS